MTREESAEPTEPSEPMWIERIRQLRLRTGGPITTGLLWDKLHDDGVSGLPGSRRAAANEYASAGLLWQGVYDVSFDEGTVQAAHRIGLITHQDKVALLRRILEAQGRSSGDADSPLSGLPEEVEEEVEVATLNNQLTIVNGDLLRLVFWGEEPIRVDWNTHDVAWQFLWALVRARVYGQQLDSGMLGQGASDSRLRDWRRRLRDQLMEISECTPTASYLDAVIIPGNRAATYQLNLRHSEVWARRFSGDISSLEPAESF